MQRFIVLDSDGESNYKYDYNEVNGNYFVTAYKDGEFWYETGVTKFEFELMKERAQ